MSNLSFDPIATQIGDADVVSFLCYVSEPLSDDDHYCLILSPWFDDRIMVKKSDVKAGISGSQRADGRSLVWVAHDATVTRTRGWAATGNATEDDLAAYAVAEEVGLEDARTTGGGSGANPPPIRYPKT